MRRIKVPLIFAFILSIVMATNTEASNLNEMSVEEMYTKQSVVKSAFQEALLELNITEEDFNNEGNYYLNEQKNPIFHIKKDVVGTSGTLKESTPKAERKIIKMQEKIEKKLNKSVKTKIVEYSYNDLTKAQDDLVNHIMKSEIILAGEYKTSLNSIDNRIDLTVSDISESDKAKIIKKFGNIINVIIDPEYELTIVPESLATDKVKTYNKLGAGIGITTSDGGLCTLGAIAQNQAGDYFIVTAAHCLNTATFFQYTSHSVGRVHLNSMEGGYDVGLIRIISSSLQRYVTNGLLSEGIVNYNYDKKLMSSMYQRAGDTVCLEGLKTWHSCGRITDVRMVLEPKNYAPKKFVGTEVTSYDGTSLSQGGDSGGPWHYMTNSGQSLVGIHHGGNTEKDDVSYFTPWVEYRNNYGLELYTSSTVVPLN
ncbi:MULTISPECIES: S1 family peptidase [Planococcus]|uniref:Peptidase S1 domain-containing protein n=1 Tax=Planococcus faecalis TaxID=1598147 RepID=A0ABM6IRF7_9BACL|nr:MULTISPECIES: S1 family peptidase [Planococcus]AQU78886.1 hypothetical protein AJGP001_06280 [Planococcus faecalis]MDJ0333045.1 S1 family peptidase [Planococcus sp. S3-L1]OHX51371.1 hypothetical protein BB777_17170 [Planococcus faecalis]